MHAIIVICMYYNRKQMLRLYKPKQCTMLQISFFLLESILHSFRLLLLASSLLWPYCYQARVAFLCSLVCSRLHVSARQVRSTDRADVCMARAQKCALRQALLRSARECQPIERMMYARGRMLAMYLTCGREGESEVWEQYSRFSELAPKALNIGYNVRRSTV